MKYSIVIIFCLLLGCTEEVIVPKYVYLQGEDSIVYRDSILLQIDTLIERYYKDTLVQYIAHSTTDIPEELVHIVAQFYIDTDTLDLFPTGSELVVVYADPNSMPVKGWNSYSHSFASQDVIVLNEQIQTKYQFASIYRELARLELRKQYILEGDVIMNPLFDPKRLTIRSLDKGRYLDVLFKQ